MDEVTERRIETVKSYDASPRKTIYQLVYLIITLFKLDRLVYEFLHNFRMNNKLNNNN